MRTLVFLLLSGIGYALYAQQDSIDAKSVFVGNKCEACHSVSTAQIACLKKNATQDSKSVDLSTVGMTRTSVWIADYLLKKEEIEGKKHIKRFKGTDDELKVLSEWLVGQSIVN